MADLHNPLALSENFDGQKTGQHGPLGALLDQAARGMDKKLNFGGSAARLIDDPRGYVFSMITQTYIWLDNLLYQEELAKRGQSGYTEIYYDTWRKGGAAAEGPAGGSHHRCRQLWYTAWTTAGRPELK